ncbi:MAG: DUF2505 domain-containing protein [Pseudomonadales bacterium]|nr:DUF2505 domain-containing protein [Pseudomonadales bacterium]
MRIEYPVTLPVNEAIEYLTDPDFLVERSIAIGEMSADAEVAEDDEGTLYVSMNRLVTRELPSFLAKIFDPKQQLSMEEAWQQDDDIWHCKGSYTVEGQPVEINTIISLTPSETGSIYAIEFKVKAKIPMIGGKVEKFIKSNCQEGTQKEIDFLNSKAA